MSYINEKFVCQLPATVTGHDGINLFKRKNYIFVMLCAIWHHMYNLRKMKNTHDGVLL